MHICMIERQCDKRGLESHCHAKISCVYLYSDLDTLRLCWYERSVKIVVPRL